MADLASYLQSVKLPVMPEVAHALIRTLTDPNADVPMVVGVISKDPSLTATLLRMANSAMFGLSRSVQTLDAAVSVVGMTQIRARALSICIANAFELPSGLNRLDFWRDCMVCAGYTKWLAASAGHDVHQAWLTAMMLRLGEVVIAQRSPEMLERIEQRPMAPGERWARERALLGFDEGEITAALAERWDFPEVMSIALRQCAAPTAAAHTSKLSMLMHLGSLLADQAADGSPTLETLPADLLRALHLDIATLQPKLPAAESFNDLSLLQT